MFTTPSLSSPYLYTVKCIPIARQRLGKHIPARANTGKNRTSITRKRISKHPFLTIEAVFSVASVRSGYKEVTSPRVTRVEAGSNTSTVTLRVVGGDETGSLKSETVKYGRKSQGTTTEKDCAGKGQRLIQKTDPSSRQRGRPTE
jgi:hypothetical protein